MKTQEQYLKSRDELWQTAAGCPCCDSQDIEGHSVEIDCDYASQIVSCSDCGARWLDSYKLIGFDLWDPPTKEATA